jgi:hypothetical protein
VVAVVPLVAGALFVAPAGVVHGLGDDRTGRANDQRRRGGGDEKIFHEMKAFDLSAGRNSDLMDQMPVRGKCSK